MVKTIRRKTRQTYSSEEKIRTVLAGLRGEETISVLCRREGISERSYYSWSKEFPEAGKPSAQKKHDRGWGVRGMRYPAHQIMW
ncbi:MAG: transposase [Rhodobacteraceae bacterium]|nr:transposase [Paracoccaceae bacterium]